MNETYVTREIMQSWQGRQRVYYHKLADAGGLDFSQPRAVDVLGCISGHFFGIEFKLHKEPHAAFAIAKVREEQIKELLHIEHALGVAYLAIVHTFDKQVRLYVLTPHQWIYECGIANRTVRKSIPLPRLALYEIRRHTGGTKYDFDFSFVESDAILARASAIGQSLL